MMNNEYVLRFSSMIVFHDDSFLVKIPNRRNHQHAAALSLIQDFRTIIMNKAMMKIPMLEDTIEEELLLPNHNHPLHKSIALLTHKIG